MQKIYSFDVFDTCLTRRVCVPSGVFYDVARKVFTKLGIPETPESIEDFVSARKAAEKMAREQSISEEISLDDIWGLLVRKMGLESDLDLITCELDAEELSIIPILSTLEYVKKLRAEGCKIIFVSDMYLPKNFIQKNLLKHGFAESTDALYLSSDIGKTKSTGNLFKHLLVSENVPPDKILHIGDDQHSDVVIPQGLGIRTRLFNSKVLMNAESQILRKCHNFQAATELAGAMRVFRLNESFHGGDVIELNSQFVAPFVMTFAVWVLQQARGKGIKRLYFLSRDCQMVWKAACEITKEFGDIDCRYLLVSRQALYLPTTTSICPKGMPWMRRKGELPILKNLLAKIELEFEDVRSFFGEVDKEQGENYCLQSESDWQSFWRALNQEPIKNRIFDLVGERLPAAQDFFRSEGLFDTEPWAIVDLGWYLTGQRSIFKILKSAGWEGRMYGFYLALKQERTSPSEAGFADALFYQPPSDYNGSIPAADIFSYQTPLEHIIGISDHTSVHHYEYQNGSVLAVFQQNASEKHFETTKKLHDLVIKFASSNLQISKYLFDFSFCREAIISLSSAFFQTPSRQLVKPLRQLFFTGDQNGLDSRPIVAPLSFRYLLHELFPAWVPFFRSPSGEPYIWPEGSRANTSRVKLMAADCLTFPFVLANLVLEFCSRITMFLAIRTRINRYLKTPLRRHFD